MKTAVQGAVTSVKALGALLASAGVIVGIIIGAMFSRSFQSAEPLSQEVLSYTPTIQKYTSQYGIPEYVSVLQAIMMQESGGKGTDPMQSGECPYNTRFPNSPNAITELNYSIQVGVQYYASCVAEAGCTSPYDMDKLKLSLRDITTETGISHGQYETTGDTARQTPCSFHRSRRHPTAGRGTAIRSM